MKLRAIVLAAGRSTRIAPLFPGVPKPLIRIAGEPLLSRNLRWLRAQGVSEVWINLHYGPELIRSALGDGARLGLKIQYVFEPELLGTAGAVRNIAERWTERVAVIYGDNLICTDLGALARAHIDHCAAATVAVFDRGHHPHTGIAGGRVRLDGAGRIVAFLEGAGDEASPLVNAGVYLLEPEVVRMIPPGGFYDFARDLFPAMLAAGQTLWGEPISAYCLGFDTPESYARALKLIADKEVVLQ